MNNPSNFKTQYQQIQPDLLKELGQSNVLALPKVSKVVVNVGVGRFLKDSKGLDNIIADIESITGQKPIKTQARQSIAGFKIREGNIVGLKATLRGRRKEEFLEKLLQIALPRIRDFRGISVKGFDPQGNYSLGIKEQTIFPEISGEKTTLIFPFEITVVTTARDKKEGYALLKALGFPFKDEI